MQYDYATDEPFVVTSSYSAGPDHYLNMYAVNISIDHNGNLLLYTTENDDLKIGEDAPVIKVKLDEERVNDVKHVIEEQNFWKLPKDVSTPSEDGGFSYVIVNLKEKSKKVGGLNPDDPQYIEIRKFISSLVDGDDYEKWQEDIEEHIWENNSLRYDKKTDFNMDEPFLVLSMEHLVGDEFRNVYLQNISIDMSGNVVLYADAESSKLEIDREAPKLEMKITDKELETIQELIQTHFWKLNEFIRNPDGGDRVSTITVNLTEESKTVMGHDPNHQRFIAIRDGIIQLIDKEDYEKWEKDIKTHIKKTNTDE